MAAIGTPAVLVFTPVYALSNDGVAIVTESLVQSLRGIGVPCAVIEAVGDGWFPRARRGTAGELIVTLCVRNVDPASRWTTRAAGWIRATMAGIVIGMLTRLYDLRVAHFHFSLPEYGVLHRRCARYGFRFVATFHGSDVAVGLDDPSTRAAMTELVRDCAVVTTVSGALRDTLLGFIPEVGPVTRVVHNSVPAPFASRLREEDVRPRDIDVLFVGNLIRRKGVDVLLQAFATARQSMPLSLVIAGDGPERSQLETLARDIGISDSVRFMGHQGRDSVMELFQRAQVVVVPSREEPFGLVLVEAQMCRAAVVASDVGGIPEIVVDDVTGVLVASEDPTALADAIVALSRDDVRRIGIATRGRERALSHFSPDAIVRAYCDVYRSAIRGTAT